MGDRGKITKIMTPFRRFFLLPLIVLFLVFTLGKLWAYFIGQPAVEVLGQSTFTTSAAVTSLTGLNNPTGVGGDTSYLYVADNTASRVMVYPFPPTGNGMSASWILG